MEQKVDTVILVYAVRYALGRQTGAVLDVINNVMNNIDKIEEKYKGVMLKDIIEHLHEVKDAKFQWQDIILSWKGLAQELFKRCSDETRDWVVNPLGGGATEEDMKFICDLCPYCGKPIIHPYTDTVWVNHNEKKMTFCSGECAGYYQMGAES